MDLSQPGNIEAHRAKLLGESGDMPPTFYVAGVAIFFILSEKLLYDFV